MRNATEPDLVLGRFINRYELADASETKSIDLEHLPTKEDPCCGNRSSKTAQASLSPGEEKRTSQHSPLY